MAFLNIKQSKCPPYPLFFFCEAVFSQMFTLSLKFWIEYIKFLKNLIGIVTDIVLNIYVIIS